METARGDLLLSLDCHVARERTVFSTGKSARGAECKKNLSE
jgi:hypothetical protein